MSSVILRQSNQLCRALRSCTLGIKVGAGCNAAYTSQSCLETRASALLVAISNSLDSPCSFTQRQSFRSGREPRALQLWQQSRYLGAAAQPIPAEEDIVLTDHAVEKLHELCKGQGDQCLRLTVEAGGCSGFSYKFDLDSKITEGDRVFEAGGVRLVADSMSYEFVRGSKIDYSQELIKSSFEVVDNPNADKGCGCGTSFSPK